MSAQVGVAASKSMPVEYVSITVLLAGFRRGLERDTGVSIERLDVNAAILLDDVAVCIGLSEKRRREMLGDRAADFVKGCKDEHVNPS